MHLFVLSILVKKISAYYAEEPKYFVAVDCVIFGFDKGKLKLLLVKRFRPPEKGEWSLMGDFLQPTETLESSAQRTLTKWTGLQNVFLEQFYCFSNLGRDPGERVLSVAYYALIKIDDTDKKLTKSHDAQWIEIGNIPKLIFDHQDMVNMAMEVIKHKCRFEPLGFELLPEQFTIPQLQKLYEEILQFKLDNANFRKKILSMKVLKKLNKKDKSLSKKGAYYYTFDKDMYIKYSESGNFFEI